tara:strand:- start:256 stop:435 length:180 start_codon:yes stop_codon:yes gene_type:complete
MRLNEWVALDQGFFEAEGLDVHVNWNGLKLQQGNLGKPEDKVQTKKALVLRPATPLRCM